VPVFRMRPYKPRSRVAVGVARKRSLPAQRPWAPSIGLNLQPCHRQWWQPPDSWKIVRVAINKHLTPVVTFSTLIPLDGKKNRPAVNHETFLKR
jgi:hypothetical protein